MALDASRRAKAEAWLAATPQVKCPICTGRSFKFGDILVPEALSPAGTAGAVPVAARLLQLEVCCADCGCITLFSAARAGLP